MKITPDEKLLWQELAHNHKTTLSNLIRNKLNNTKLKRQPQKVDPNLIREINRIGNNLNQIARKINTDNKLDILMELTTIERLLKNIVDDYKTH